MTSNPTGALLNVAVTVAVPPIPRVDVALLSSVTVGKVVSTACTFSTAAWLLLPTELVNFPAATLTVIFVVEFALGVMGSV